MDQCWWQSFGEDCLLYNVVMIVVEVITYFVLVPKWFPPSSLDISNPSAKTMALLPKISLIQPLFSYPTQCPQLRPSGHGAWTWTATPWPSTLLLRLPHLQPHCCRAATVSFVKWEPGHIVFFSKFSRALILVSRAPSMCLVPFPPVWLSIFHQPFPSTSCSRTTLVSVPEALQTHSFIRRRLIE